MRMGKPPKDPLNKQSHKGCAPSIRKLKSKYPELSNHAIARRVGCDESNVRGVLQRFLGTNTQADLQEFQESKAEIYDALQHRLLQSITDEHIAKAPVYPRIISAGILEDKARTIRGQATSINVAVLVDLVEAIKAKR